MFKLSILLYSIVYNFLMTFKNGIVKLNLTDYINKTSIMNFIFIKHIIKSLLYISIFIILYIVNKNYFKAVKYIRPNLKLLLAIGFVALLEILTAFPFYEAFKKFKLSYFIPVSIIVYTLFNSLLSHYILKESFSYKVILGSLIAVFGLYLILSNGSD